MLKPDKIPTKLQVEKERKHLQTRPPREPRFRGVMIFVGACRLIFGLLYLYIRRQTTPTKRAILTRQFFEDLGFLWIKVGQLLSLRRDFFTEEFCSELSRLQSESIGFTPSLAIETIERELGGPISEFFSEFDPQPMAAASIAQVHRARVRGSDAEVVVKVRRPGAEKIFYRDLKVIGRLTGLLNRFGVLSFMRWNEALWELKEIMKEETDYRFEIANIKKMRKPLKKHGIYVPETFPELSTSAIMVLELIPGLLMSNYIDAEENAPEALDIWKEENNFDPVKAGNRLNYSFLRQLFEDGVFHGDLHPGNVILLRNSKIALIDFGTVGTPEQDLWRRYLYIVKALAVREFQKAADLILSLCPELPLVDVENTREEIVRSLRSWHMSTSVDQLSYHEKSATKSLTGVLQIMGERKMMLTWGFLRIDRTWATLDGSLFHLTPKADYPKIFEKYFERRARREFLQMYSWQNVGRAMVEVPEALNEVRLFLEPQMRRASRVYGGFASKMARTTATILKAFGTVCLGLSVYLTASMLEQLHGWFRSSEQLDVFVYTLVEPFPEMAAPFWTLTLLGAYYVTYLVRRMKNQIQRDDVRMPNNSTAS